MMRWFSKVVVCALLAACAQSAPPASAPAAREPAATLGEFAPGSADPARRARLEALRPALDAFFESKLKESGATGLA
ncbi:MAG TPA: hypothetical protein VGQ57_21630, partial [Polyangiaceae bacterium]|nr:hypothetical protein [Polyangiaceae bacterium]